MAQDIANTPERAWHKFSQARFVLLVTQDAEGSYYGAPMTLQLADDGALWFFIADDSPTARHIGAGGPVGVMLMDNHDSFYFTGHGHAQPSRDSSAKSRLWNKMTEAWFPDGPDDPHVLLMRVDVERAEYWDSTSNRMVQMAAMAKALLTKKPPTEIGEHGTLENQRG